MSGYAEFLEGRRQESSQHGFAPVWEPDFLFDFQALLLDWSVRQGKSAIFADCGLGKTPIQLAWAENVVRKANKSVLILTPLAVSEQTVREGAKFGVECFHSRDGRFPRRGARVVVTNYERLHYFEPEVFAGVVCDESGILKNFDGTRKAQITEFMRTRPYRLLCTATAAPNDYIELGTSSEALGELGYMDMLGKFFKNAQNSLHPTSGRGRWELGSREIGIKWRFRGHSETEFWRWVCSWARALRKPSDLGCDDSRFVLPPLETHEHVVKSRTAKKGQLLSLPAENLHEQREERRRTLQERCEKAAELASEIPGPVVLWCHLNSEGDLLQRLVLGAIQVSGSDSDEEKEEAFRAFSAGEIRALVTKPTIAGFGLNWQHCAHQTFFPSHSFEQWYQAVRRSWRFGQEKPVRVDVVTSEGEAGVLRNLKRKAKQADEMFARLVELMGNQLKIRTGHEFPLKEEIPRWL